MIYGTSVLGRNESPPSLQTDVASEGQADGWMNGLPPFLSMGPLIKGSGLLFFNLIQFNFNNFTGRKVTRPPAEHDARPSYVKIRDHKNPFPHKYGINKAARRGDLQMEESER